MKQHAIQVVTALALLASSTVHAQQAVQWSNGHWYFLSGGQMGNSTASDARAGAAANGAHLITINSEAEAVFVTQSLFWQYSEANIWLGAHRDDVGNWAWDTGEPWGYSNFANSMCNYGSEAIRMGDAGSVCGTGNSPIGPWAIWPMNYPVYVRAGLEWDADCNSDGIVDYGQIHDGTFQDTNVNGIPDCCDMGVSCASGSIDLGIQARFEFDGNCDDSSTHGRNGLPSGVQVRQDRFNQPDRAAYLNGKTSDIQVQGIPIPSNNAFSWTLWLRVDAIANAPVLQRIDAVGNNLMSPSLWIRSDGRISLVSYLIGTGGFDLDTPASSVSAGTWIHVACTSASTGLRRIYLNGALVAEAVAPNYGQELGLLLVGRDRIDSWPRLMGAIDELRIYDRALSVAEVIEVRDVSTPTDTDGDGRPDSIDNCPTIANPTQADCNNNGTGDVCEVAAGSPDYNRDTIPDHCQCLADLFVDHQVNGADLGALLAVWGPANANTASDMNRDGVVNGADLGYLLYAWGPCPN